MSNYPVSTDDDISLPPVTDNIVEIGGEAIQAIRSAIFAVETELGIGASGTTGSVANRIGVALNADGTVRAQAIAGLGLVVLPITDSQISPTAAIQESKLNLTYSTASLFTSIGVMENDVDVLQDFVSTAGAEILPHIAGTAFRHKLSHIDVDAGALSRVDITTGSFLSRNLTNSYTFTSEMANDMLLHTRADKINNTTTPPPNQAHNAAGIYINPTHFTSIPQTANDLQTFAEFVDNSSLILLGSRTQNLYENGIPRASRASSLVNVLAGEAVVAPTPVTTYLLFSSAVNPVDDIDHGDDIILFNPSAGVLANNTFDAQFSQVKPGDYITITYGGNVGIVTFTIDSVRKFLNGSTRVYSVRINGKNLLATSSATARIDRPFYHDNKFNSLAVATANNIFSVIPSLIIGSPRGASVLGINFDPEQLNGTHYNIYLAMYPTGNPLDRVSSLPAIDVTGNAGTTPGAYTLDTVVNAFNNAVRANGFNYRFIGFSYQGQFGISLADHYNDVSFSVIAGVVDSSGNYTSISNASYPNNVVDNFNGFDALGFGIANANVASPPFATSYASPLSGFTTPTLILAPTRKDFFYVNGVERDNFALEEQITRDGYGDGYWSAVLITRTALSGRVEVTYQVDLDLSSSGLEIGKTIVVQPAVAFTSGSYNDTDYGRFIISDVVFTDCPGPTPITTITVYDGIHGVGFSPASSSVTIPVQLYFTSDSVIFNSEQASDPSTHMTFRRFFEIYVDPNGKSFTHERARFNTAGTNLVIDSATGFTLFSAIELAIINIVDVSPKLRGYIYGQYRKIDLFISAYDQTTGIFSGFLARFDSPSTYTHLGPVTVGKKGEIVRFYDETNIDYIDIKFNNSDSISSFVSKNIDIQLFPSLELNQEKILLSKCQLSDSIKNVALISDARPFGNVSEQQLSSSALDFIAAPEKSFTANGVVRGFDVISTNINGKITINGGTALIDGKIVNFNNEIILTPLLIETLSPSFVTTENIKWYLCANSRGEFEFIASTDYALGLAGAYGSLDHNRLFYVKNPNSPSTLPYIIRSAFLQNLILTMRDLVPLYIVHSNVSGTSFSSISASDIRRYVEHGYQGLTNSFILGSTSAYRTLASLDNTITELTGNIAFSVDNKNTIGSIVYVRDNFDITGFTFNYGTPIKFIGDGGGFKQDVSASPSILGNNIIFKDLPITVTADVGINVQGDNIILDNCNIIYNYDATADSSFTASNLNNINKACIFSQTSIGITSNNIHHRAGLKIINCAFTSSTINRFPFISLLLDGETDYLQNINISNNVINTLIGNSVDDKRAVISIAVNISTIPTAILLSGPKLINCQISDNICNKNQLISISTVPSGSLQIIETIIPINVVIEKNICGAINYLTRQETVMNIANINSIKDKDNLLTISNNVCRYIYCGTSTGFINIIGSTNHVIYDFISNAGLYSSSVIITNNVCSWIHIGIRNFLGPSNIITQIDGNRLTAFNPIFLNDYYSIITPVNIGLIVDNTQGG